MYDRKHVLLTWGGALPGGETWTCGIRLAGKVSDAASAPLPSVISDDFLTSLMGSYVPAVKTFHSDAATGVHSSCTLKFVKAAAIGLNGKYLDGQASMVLSEFDPVPGGVGGAAHPNQICLAITTTTDVKRGLAKRGRWYLPMPAFVVGANGLIGVAEADNVRGSAKTFVEAISDVPGVDIITSPGAAVMSKVGGGASNRITGISVGRVLDTQRRRRRSLPETYEAVGVDQGAF